MKALLGYNVYSAVQQILHVHEHASECEARSFRRKRHEQVNIAAIIGVAPCHRPEYTYIADAVTLRDSKDRSSVLVDNGVHRLHHPPAKPSPHC